MVGNKRYFLESEVCRGHLTRKQHCNLDSERRSLINIQTTCHLLVSPHLALGLSCRGLTKMGSYLEDYYRRYNENINRWPGYILDQISIYLYSSTKPQQASTGGRARQTGEVGVSVGRAGGQPPHLHRPPLGLVLGPQQAADHGLGSLQLQLPAAIPCSVSLLVFHQ